MIVCPFIIHYKLFIDHYALIVYGFFRFRARSCAVS